MVLQGGGKRKKSKTRKTSKGKGRKRSGSRKRSKSPKTGILKDLDMISKQVFGNQNALNFTTGSRLKKRYSQGYENKHKSKVILIYLIHINH